MFTPCFRTAEKLPNETLSLLSLGWCLLLQHMRAQNRISHRPLHHFTTTSSEAPPAASPTTASETTSASTPWSTPSTPGLISNLLPRLVLRLGRVVNQ